MECPEKKFYATQFHPEVHAYRRRKEDAAQLRVQSMRLYRRLEDGFLRGERRSRQIREKVGDGKALCALSGGVDSSVAAVIMSKAIGKQLTCVFVDHGLLRKNEGDEVEAVFGPDGPYDLNFIRVNAQQRFYDKLAGRDGTGAEAEDHRRGVYPRL